jgi:hypothetical protein
VPVLVLAVAAALAAGAAASVAGKGDPQRAITKADQARAKAMLLRRADFAAGFTATKPGPDADLYCAALDESDLTITGDADSPDFTRQASATFLSIQSGATIYRTQAEALTSWRRGTSAAGERCARDVLAKEFRKSGLLVKRLSRVTFPKLAPLTVAYRLVVTGTGQAGTVAAYGDIVVMQRGRAQAGVLVLSLGAPLVRPELVFFARAVARRQAKAMGT